MMRKKDSYQFHCAYSLFIVLLLVVLSLINPVSTAADNDQQLIILLFDSSATSWEPLDENIVLEGKEYDIVVKQSNEQTIAYGVTITITLFEEVYVTSEELPWITLEAPCFDNYSEFVITATKQGYTSAEKYILVSKGDLFVSVDRDTVEEEGSFSVTINDQFNKPIPEVTIYIEGDETILETTNENGKAYVTAPLVEDNTELTITAVKSGYYPGSNTIHVTNIKETAIGSFMSKFFEVSPVVFALLTVVFAMIFVRYRKKEPITHKTVTENTPQIQPKFKENKKSQILTKSQPIPIQENINTEQSTKSSVSAKGSHVEVIRIRSKDEKKTETQHIVDKKEKPKPKSLPMKTSQDYEWFNGTEYMKYKLNKLTGEDNEKPAEKWFVGEDDIRFMVDKKLTDKKLKKKTKKNAA